jgi:hypothetical protein
VLCPHVDKTWIIRTQLIQRVNARRFVAVIARNCVISELPLTVTEVKAFV